MTYVLVKGDMKVTNLLQAEFNPKRPIRGTIWLLNHYMYYMTYAIPFEKLQETGAVISGNAICLQLLISPTDLAKL